MSIEDDGETASNFGNYDQGPSSLIDPLLLNDYKPIDDHDVPTEQNLELVNSVEQKFGGEFTGKI